MMARLTLIVAATIPDAIEAQTRDTVVQAHPEYQAGNLRRLLMGENYRKEWATPIHVPVLDLYSYGGGLTPLKTGGGQATSSLRLLGADGAQYSFRPVFKSVVNLPDEFRYTLIWTMFEDARTAIHPTGAIAPTP